MKEGIHPDNYRLVVFKDMSNEYAFLSKSAAETKENHPVGRWERVPARESGSEPPKPSFLHGQGAIRGYSWSNRQIPPEVRKVRQESGQGLIHTDQKKKELGKLPGSFFCLHCKIKNPYFESALGTPQTPIASTLSIVNPNPASPVGWLELLRSLMFLTPTLRRIWAPMPRSFESSLGKVP